MGEVIGIGEAATRAMKEEGIEVGFGVTGFHSEMLYAMFPEYGMKLYTMRHEQAGAYAADGYAGASRKMAMCYGTAGPGVTNMTSSIAQAYQNYRPMLALCGMHGSVIDHHGTIQEAYPVEIMRSCCKFAYQINHSDTMLYWIRRACKIAREYPPGPVVLAYSPQVVGWTKDTDEYAFTYPREQVAFPSPASGDPQAVEKAVRMILDAKRPLILTGDGTYWAHAENELKEFAELTQTPVCCRRASRGSIPEGHPLVVGPGSRGPIMTNADLLIFFGMRDTVTEAHYQPYPVGAYPADVPVIQVNESTCDLIDFLPSPIQVIGNVKSVLKQMIECTNDLLKNRQAPQREELVREIAEVKEQWRSDMSSVGLSQMGNSPVTGDGFKQAMRSFLESAGDTTVILDSFTGSWHVSDGYYARFPGQCLDSGGWSGVGHGVAMGFGVQVAKPGHQVLVIMGDGGVGVGGMEIETCARYKMPVVTVVWNNSRWMGGIYEWLYCRLAGDNRLQQDIKYDQMFGVLEGVHSEICTTADEVRPALERAFNSGKTAVVNVLAESAGKVHPWVFGIPVQYMRWFGIERMRELLPKEFQDRIESMGGPQAAMDTLISSVKYIGL